MTAYDEALKKLKEQQSAVEEFSAPWMVAEQLMDICRKEPKSAGLISQDLDNPEMGIVQAEKQIKAYSDANHKGNRCYCVSPVQAENILRKFYGLPDSGGHPAEESPAGLGVDLSVFLGG